MSKYSSIFTRPSRTVYYVFHRWHEWGDYEFAKVQNRQEGNRMIANFTKAGCYDAFLKEFPSQQFARAQINASWR